MWPSRAGAWDSGRWRITVCGGAWIGVWLRCFEKSCRSPLCAPDDVVGVGKYRRGKVAGKYHRKNVDGDEGFLTTIWLTGKLWEMEKVTRMKHGHWTDSRN